MSNSPVLWVKPALFFMTNKRTEYIDYVKKNMHDHVKLMRYLNSFLMYDNIEGFLTVLELAHGKKIDNISIYEIKEKLEKLDMKLSIDKRLIKTRRPAHE